MSNIAIQGAATGTGVFTLASPATNTDRTLVLPDEAGTVLTTAGVPASAMPAGSVLQVVTVNKTDTFSLSSQTFTDITGLSASITPSATSSKILVLASVMIGADLDFAYIRLLRDSTVIDVGDAAGSRPQVTGAISYASSSQIYNTSQIPVLFLDSPATTNATTYKFQLRSGSTAGPVYINRTSGDRDTVNYEWRTPSNIVLMEIAA
jgi:hypothetical protein